MTDLQNHPMYKDLLMFAKAIDFQMTENKEQDVKQLLLRWVNHRVDVTPQMIEYMFNNYCESKQIN